METKSQKQKILEMFYEKDWVTVQELHAVCWRYGGRLFDLRQDGYQFEKRKQENGLEEWKLLNKNYSSSFKDCYEIPQLKGTKEQLNQLTLI